METLGKKGTKEDKGKLDIVKVPCIITNYKPNKMTHERDITITVSPDYLHYAQQMDANLGGQFIAFFVAVKSKEEADSLLKNGLGDIDITP